MHIIMEFWWKIKESSFISDNNLFTKIEHLNYGLEPVQNPEIYVKTGLLTHAENQEIGASGVNSMQKILSPMAVC